ncbi:hypothetical protein FBUS_09683 [Fasciolopsis buskii]|uniref:Uncharacterized protein n=1 Tax=Fasciolopsis buskii TaxID=27845 RepID=A0A8E0VGN3_9TREM|nr:hypothetical protein FBUS_09683 [Fasciolopsis buski]
MHALNRTNCLGPSGFLKNSSLRILFSSASTELEHISAVAEEETAAAKTFGSNTLSSQAAHDPINLRASNLSSGIICLDTVDNEVDDDDLASAFRYLTSWGPSDVVQIVSHANSFTPLSGRGILMTSSFST